MNYFKELNPILQTLISSIYMSLMTTLGGAIIFLKNKPNKKFSIIAESSAAGIMLAASFFSLLNPAFEYKNRLPGYVTVTLGFCIGVAFILLSDTIFNRKKTDKYNLCTKNKLLFTAVTVHNIPEGMAVGVAFGSSGCMSALLLAIGIGIQNLPEGSCISCPFRSSGKSKVKSFLYAAISGLVEIPSALIGIIATVYISNLMPWALSFAAGAMVAVTVTELIPESFNENKILSLISLMFGFALMMFLDTVLG